MKCVRKDQFDCIKLTKQNRDEALKILEPHFDNKQIYIEKDNDKYLIIEYARYPNSKKYYFYNHWYVKNIDNYYIWNRYTDEEFREEFELVK